MGKYLDIILAKRRKDMMTCEVQDELNESYELRGDATNHKYMVVEDNIPDVSPIVDVSETSSIEIISDRPYWQRPDGSCYACNGRAYWVSIYNVSLCSLCHPPAN